MEPQWLARIQPHTAFDEGWILKLNQSHMSPTEREKDWERETEGVVGMERLKEGWKTGRSKETGNGRWYRTGGAEGE